MRTHTIHQHRKVESWHTPTKPIPWHVKEARGTAWHPSEFAREGSAYTRHRRDLSKRIRARERREMDRIIRDLEAWEGYYPTGNSVYS